VLGERVRLSRELHDTLLQSLVGVALEFDAVSKSLDTSPAAAKERVVKIRERVEEYIREARRSIWSLRSPALETGDLVDALREGAERATSDQPVSLEFTVSGAPQRYGSDVEHQLMRIGQEAVLNAARHAHAHTIRMHVDFTSDTVALRVSDDGRGFDAGNGAEGTTDHYGITTMRERAEQVGGHVTITSAPGQGTVVEAVVPVVDADAESTSV
jgi:signal transduction histidine kinase